MKRFRRKKRPSKRRVGTFRIASKDNVFHFLLGVIPWVIAGTFKANGLLKNIKMPGNL